MAEFEYRSAVLIGNASTVSEILRPHVMELPVIWFDSGNYTTGMIPN
jgi:hypothetical protein